MIEMAFVEERFNKAGLSRPTRSIDKYSALLRKVELANLPDCPAVLSEKVKGV